jgi:prevent-host-death family protein
MGSVTAREASRQFSKLLRRVMAGVEVVITRRGTLVARLVPIPDANAKADAEASEQERRAIIAWLRSGPLRGGVVAEWTRDEIYDRDDRSAAECE